MKKITKAVIPAAGLGTRVLPATKAMPKGMLPIVDKPAIQYLVEEAVRSGITDILIIVSRNQDIIQDHFDRSPELEAKLAAPGKEKMLEECLGISNLANIFFVRQQQHTQQHGPKADASLGAKHGLTLLGVGELRLDAADVVGGTFAVEPLAVHTAHQHQHEAEDRADAGKYRQS